MGQSNKRSHWVRLGTSVIRIATSEVATGTSELSILANLHLLAIY